MRTRSKLLLAGLTAALVLSMGVSSASANRLSVSNRNTRIVWTPLTFDAGGNTVRCNVTLEGSFHSATIRKVNDALVGHISRASLNTCAGGSATVLTASLPWHIKYQGFTGTLPTITGVRLLMINASFRVQPSGLPACLARTTTEEPARGIAQISGGVITGLRADETAEIALEGFLCSFAGEGHFIGTGAVTLLGAATSITVTLI